MSEYNIESFLKVDENSDFPIQNLPYGIFSEKGKNNPRVGVAIGDQILDLSILEKEELLPTNSDVNVFDQKYLNNFMELGRTVWKNVRSEIQRLLNKDTQDLRDNNQLRSKVFFKMQECDLLIPIKTTDFTDFYASRDHAFNVGTMFRGPESALMDNWLHIPIAYHGRASSIIVSGQDIKRPSGQLKPPTMDKPYFGPSKRLDYEFEMGIYIGVGNDLGEPIPIANTMDHIFGLVILNDWSARDIQGWEYRPLGPFNAKNFASSVSPWVVPIDALTDFQIELPTQDPEVLDYLKEDKRISFNITLDIELQTEKMDKPVLLGKSNFKNIYWTMNQMVAHHSITGCNMQTGDLLGTGTISGPTKESRASLLESSWGGKEPISLPNGEERKFLEDGDTVIMKAYCQNDKYRIGFGEVRTTILPAN
ncbi:MAG: fumarylacetoacetase [Candidatus Heimdallarchaeota archaeon]|nr:fumarylacetoacetase [Candidatus Heimdallarchaeota archaeon]